MEGARIRLFLMSDIQSTYDACMLRNIDFESSSLKTLGSIELSPVVSLRLHKHIIFMKLGNQYFSPSSARIYRWRSWRNLVCIT